MYSLCLGSEGIQLLRISLEWINNNDKTYQIKTFFAPFRLAVVTVWCEARCLLKNACQLRFTYEPFPYCRYLVKSISPVISPAQIFYVDWFFKINLNTVHLYCLRSHTGTKISATWERMANCWMYGIQCGEARRCSQNWKTTHKERSAVLNCHIHHWNI